MWKKKKHSQLSYASISFDDPNMGESLQLDNSPDLRGSSARFVFDEGDNNNNNNSNSSNNNSSSSSSSHDDADDDDNDKVAWHAPASPVANSRASNHSGSTTPTRNRRRGTGAPARARASAQSLVSLTSTDWLNSGEVVLQSLRGSSGKLLSPDASTDAQPNRRHTHNLHPLAERDASSEQEESPPRRQTVHTPTIVISGSTANDDTATV